MASDDFSEYAENRRQEILLNGDDDPILQVERVYKLWCNWADFALYIVSPTIERINPPLIVYPELIPDTEEYEFVYSIIDHGHYLMTSKAEDFPGGMSMYKLYMTIEKMVYMLVERLKSGGIDLETEVQVAFGGHQSAQRKAFESVINLSENVVVTNFDPGLWGERYLQTVKRLSDLGYGYPAGAPRDIFRRSPSSTPKSVGP